MRVDRVMGYAQFKVSTIVELAPLQLAVVANQIITGVVGLLDRDVLSSWTRTRDCSASKLYPNAALSSLLIIRMLVKPDQITDPTGMRVTCDHDIVADVVLVKRLEGAVAVCQVAILQ